MKSEIKEQVGRRRCAGYLYQRGMARLTGPCKPHKSPQNAKHTEGCPARLLRHERSGVIDDTRERDGLRKGATIQPRLLALGQVEVHTTT